MSLLPDVGSGPPPLSGYIPLQSSAASISSGGYSDTFASQRSTLETGAKLGHSYVLPGVAGQQAGEIHGAYHNHILMRVDLLVRKGSLLTKTLACPANSQRSGRGVAAPAAPPRIHTVNLAQAAINSVGSRVGGVGGVGGAGAPVQRGDSGADANVHENFDDDGETAAQQDFETLSNQVMTVGSLFVPALNHVRICDLMLFDWRERLQTSGPPYMAFLLYLCLKYPKLDLLICFFSAPLSTSQ